MCGYSALGFRLTYSIHCLRSVGNQLFDVLQNVFQIGLQAIKNYLDKCITYLNRGSTGTSSVESL